MAEACPPGRYLLVDGASVELRVRCSLYQYGGREPGLRVVASGVSVALGKTKQKAPLHEVAHGTHSWSRVGSKVRLMYSPTSHAERRGVHASCRNSGAKAMRFGRATGRLKWSLR